MNLSFYAAPGVLKKRETHIVADPQDIISKVCKYFKILPVIIKAPSRKRPYVYCRMMCMLFLKERTTLTLTDMGKLFNRDHTSVIHSLQTIKNLIETDPRIKNDYQNLLIQV